jgi:oleate hydratase
LHDIVSPESVTIADKTRYTHYESIIQPVTEYLEKEGIDFRLNEKVVDIVMDPENDPMSVSRIKYLSPTGLELHVTVDPNDLAFVTLGSIGAGAVIGTNTVPPDVPSSIAHDGSWSLWHNLSQKTPKFGNPSNFSTHIEDSRLQTFTVTTKDTEFFDQISQLTHNLPGSQPVLSLADTRWLVSLDIPRQPVFHGQPADVRVFWGWALHPEKEGNYIKKPIFSCSGEEIMMELLQHLHFPLVPTLSSSITIPCIIPLSTAPLLTRTCGDRPAVIPDGTTNIALLGQFVEIADEATLSMEYSVRGAQIAVNRLMDLRKEVPKPRRDHVVEFLDLLT